MLLTLLQLKRWGMIKHVGAAMAAPTCLIAATEISAKHACFLALYYNRGLHLPISI